MAGWTVAGVVHLREVCTDPVGRRVLARHSLTRKSLAITYLSREFLGDTEFRTRFAPEFARLARVREARVARVHRHIECAHGAAVIGDHVTGASVRALLGAQGALGTEAALVVFKDSLLALAACHEVGLAHGDVKPERVVLTSRGRVRLVDVGLWTSEGRRMLARSTPFYLAPEQWSDRPATPVGDVYAATVMFFECLAGAPPFYGDRVAELFAKHENALPPMEAVPEPVRGLVLRGLAKDPFNRPDAHSLLTHLDDVATSAAGSGWERRGRRELAALLAGGSALPEVPMLGGRHGGAGGRPRRPVRLAAVVGGALALAAGLSSPPLAVILPGVSIFGSGGRSPVLAFPELDHDAAPVRVVTNGPLADRALSSAAKVGTAGPAAKVAAPAPSIPVPNIHTAPYVRPLPDQIRQGSTHPDQSEPTQGEAVQGDAVQGEPSAMNPKQPDLGSTVTTPDPSLVSMPVEVPVPVELPVQVPAPVQVPVPAQTPAPIQVPAPIKALKSIPVRIKNRPHQDAYAAQDTQVQADSQGPGKEAPARHQDDTTDASGSTGKSGGPGNATTAAPSRNAGSSGH